MGILNTLNTVFVLACITGTVGCGKQGIEIPVTPDVPASTSDVPVVPANVVTDNPVSVGGATTVHLTYYSKTKTLAPVSGWSTKTYTATGYCAVVGGDDYCWDDGVKTLAWVDPINGFHYGPYGYSYFNMGTRVVSPGYEHTSGTLVTDLMPTPRVISANLLNRMAAGSVDEVLTTGVQNSIDCNDDGAGVLDCGSFVIDTNQSPL